MLCLIGAVLIALVVASVAGVLMALVSIALEGK